MTSLLSAISGRFSTSVVLGAFFPATIFAVLFRVLVISAIPSELYVPFVAPLQAMDERWEALLILLAAVVLTGLLHNLNIPLIRAYEGYTWEETWFGRMRRERYRRRMEVLTARKEWAYVLLGLLESRLRSAPEGSDQARRYARQAADANAAMGESVHGLFHGYPKAASVLPTRLGNVIRAFESYPARQYGMEAISLWPRLQAVIGKEYAAMLGEAKAGFDFMINSATLAAVLALGMMMVVLAFPDRAAAPVPLLAEMLEVAVVAAVAYWLYRQAVEQAQSWGAMVRGAFDLYRWELLKQLGYQQMPRTSAEERRIWGQVSQRLAFGDPEPELRHLLQPYAAQEAVPASPPSAVPTPASAVVSVVRGAGRPVGGTLPIHLRVTNTSATAARRLVLLDAVPPGYEYVWGSATADRGRLAVSGANPLSFELEGELGAGKSVEVRYCLLPRHSPAGNGNGRGGGAFGMVG